MVEMAEGNCHLRRIYFGFLNLVHTYIHIYMAIYKLVFMNDDAHIEGYYVC